MTAPSCTTGSATSAPQPCTPVGATSRAISPPEVRATLHLYMCNIRGLNLAPPSVQHTLHPRGCNIEYPYLLTHSRHALACKTDVSSTASLQPLTLTYPTIQVTHDRTRGKRG